MFLACELKVSCICVWFSSWSRAGFSSVFLACSALKWLEFWNRRTQCQRSVFIWRNESAFPEPEGPLCVTARNTGCGPFISVSWLKLHIQEHMSSFLFTYTQNKIRMKTKGGQFHSREQLSRNTPEGDVSVSGKVITFLLFFPPWTTGR